MYVLELFNGADSPSPRRKSSLKNIKEDNTMPAVTDQPVTQSNPEDKVTIDVPLLIRIMEYAREDAKTDMDLHDVAERLIALSTNGNTLTMTDYESIVGGETDIEEGWSDIKSGLKKGLAAGVLGAAALGAHAGGVSLPNSGGSFPPAAQQTLNKRVQAMKDAEAAKQTPTKADDESWSSGQYDSHVKSDDTMTKKNGKPTEMQKRISDVTGPNSQGEYKVSVSQNGKIVSSYVTKTPPQSWMEQKESVTEDITRFKDLVGKMRRV